MNLHILNTTQALGLEGVGENRNLREWQSYCLFVVLDFDPFRTVFSGIILVCQGRSDNNFKIIKAMHP